MSKLNFYWLIAFLNVLSIYLLLLFRGEDQTNFYNASYMIGPVISFIAGFVLLKKLGFSSKRSAVVKWAVSAILLWIIGELVTIYYLNIGKDTYPSIIDIFFLLGYLSFSTAIVLEAKLFSFRIRDLGSSTASFLGIIFLLITTIVSYIIFIGYSPEESILSNLATVGFSLGDLLMGGLSLSLLALTWNYQGGTVRYEWMWFIGGVTVSLVADLIYSLNPDIITTSSLLSTFLDILWVSGYFMWAIYFSLINDRIVKFQSKLPSK